METGDEFSLEVISRSLNDIQGEKARNERLLQSESTRRANSEFELQTIIQKRKEAEKKYINYVKRLASLKGKCTSLERQREEVMQEHNGFKQGIDEMAIEEGRKESEHKHAMDINYKMLDKIVVKFRNTKMIMMNEVEDGYFSEMERELSLLEEDYGEQTSEMKQVEGNASHYETILKSYTLEENMLKEDYANLQFIHAYFREEMEKAEKAFEKNRLNYH